MTPQEQLKLCIKNGKKRAFKDCYISKKTSIGHIVTHTHWDREWRYPLWHSRERLVHFMDNLLEILDKDPEYHAIVLDGQSVMIEDYLQIKLENEEKIKKYIKEDRIKVGPWYTLPDLYPVDGECLIRNLLKGNRYCNKLGKVMKIAFTTFGWGQIAQFPQIFAGFGINFIICAKNVSKQRAPQMEFMWEAPDGTRILTSRLGDMTRHTFFMNAYIPVRFGKKYLSKEYHYEWGNGVVIHNANTQKNQDYFKISDSEAFHSDQVKEAVQSAWDGTNETTVPDVRLLLSGSDSSSPQPVIPNIIKEANLLFEDIKFVHSTLETYADALIKEINITNLHIIKGELRDGPADDCSANALAARIPIKKLNRCVETSLIGRTEPLASALSMLGKDYPIQFASIAWKYLLLSHSHDSINGVTQDKTVDDTIYNLNQALEISNVLFDKKAAELAMDINLSKYNSDDILLLVINPYPRPVQKIEKIHIDTPRIMNAAEIAIFDCDNHEVLVQPVGRQEDIALVDDFESSPWPFSVDRHTVYMDTGLIPAGGYKIYKVSVQKQMDRSIQCWPDMRRYTDNEISKTAHVLENEFLHAQIMPNGTIDLYDKENNRNYQGLHYFEDAGDTGDFWVYYPPNQNKIYTSIGSNAKIWQIETGPLSATIGVEIKMEVPASANTSNNEKLGQGNRSDLNNIIIITSHITLQRGSRQLEIDTKIQNTARDHRMRMMFPTGIKSKQSYAAGHFNIDGRLVEPERLEDGKFYPEMQTLPQQSFVDLSDGKYGFAVINKGLTEYEAMRDDKQTLAITLFRGVRNNICAEYRAYSKYPEQDGGQLIQTLEFEYAIVLHKGNWKEGKVFEAARRFNIGISTYQITSHNNGSMPETASLYSVEPENLMLSCFKRAEDRNSFIMRLFNPTDNTIEGHICIAATIKKAYICTLNEDRQNELTLLNKNEINISVPVGKIVTVELEK